MCVAAEGPRLRWRPPRPRARGRGWSTRPGWSRLGAVCGTQGVATLIAVYGVGLMTPLDWKYAGIVWVYALAWFLVTDPVKLLAYKVLDTVKAETKTEIKMPSETKAAPKPDDKPASEPDSPAAPAPAPHA